MPSTMLAAALPEISDAADRFQSNADECHSEGPHPARATVKQLGQMCNDSHG